MEYTFYDSDELVKCFTKMSSVNSILYEDKDSDPRIQFYEFVLICG